MNETSGKLLVTGGAGFIGSHGCGNFAIHHLAAMLGCELQVRSREGIRRYVGWRKSSMPDAP